MLIAPHQLRLSSPADERVEHHLRRKFDDGDGRRLLATLEVLPPHLEVAGAHRDHELVAVDDVVRHGPLAIVLVGMRVELALGRIHDAFCHAQPLCDVERGETWLLDVRLRSQAAGAGVCEVAEELGVQSCCLGVRRAHAINTYK